MMGEMKRAELELRAPVRVSNYDHSKATEITIRNEDYDYERLRRDKNVAPEWQLN
jgi:hypothetical protein